MPDRYKFSEYPEVKHLFKKHFGLSIEPYYETMLAPGFGYVFIDIIAFDEYICNKHGSAGKFCSFIELVKQHYGQEALEFLDRIL